MKSIKYRLYLFLILTILLIASITIVFSYISNSNQIDSYYKRTTTDNAKNFASLIDVDFIQELKTVLKTDEYQQIRTVAEETKDEQLIQSYLTEKGLWNKYIQLQKQIDTYIKNMTNIKYIYIMSYEGIDATKDMYIIDDSTEPIYESGYYEEREPDFLNYDPSNTKPIISNGEWGWLCSDYYPIYNDNNECICLVGCDVDVQDMVTAKKDYLFHTISNTLIVSIIIILGAVMFVTKLLINPLNTISKEVSEFVPSSDTVESNVINLNLKGHNEITTIHDNIRSMQISIVDYIKNITDMKKDLEIKDTQITKLSAETLKDPLTRVGNKGAYLQKIQDLNKNNTNFAIIMIDINNLKQINDEYGHKAGDKYIQGCCKLICDTFGHSPVYRIGGDEFVVITENDDYNNRYILYSQLKGLFKQSYLTENKNPWDKLSASVGMAENSSEDNSAELVFKRADKAMYEEKMKFREKYGSYR